MVAIVQFTVTDLAARISAMPGHDGYTIRSAAYDLRKLHGKHLAGKPGRTRVEESSMSRDTDDPRRGQAGP